MFQRIKVDKFRQAAAIAQLKTVGAMMESSFFSICEVNKLAEILEVEKPKHLKVLHCTDFRDMPTDFKVDIAEALDAHFNVALKALGINISAEGGRYACNALEKL